MVSVPGRWVTCRGSQKSRRGVAAAASLSAEGSSTNKTAAISGGRFARLWMHSSSSKRLSVLGRPGSDLLFQALRLSTIGAGEFNGRVRDGIGYRLPANTTRPAKNGVKQAVSFHALTRGRALKIRAIKPNERLVPVSSTRCRAYTPGLSTWWSTTALKGELVSRWVSRLDAFSDYPVHT
jgi:hypothetical protein